MKVHKTRHVCKNINLHVSIQLHILEYNCRIHKVHRVTRFFMVSFNTQLVVNKCIIHMSKRKCSVFKADAIITHLCEFMHMDRKRKRNTAFISDSTTPKELKHSNITIVISLIHATVEQKNLR